MANTGRLIYASPPRRGFVARGVTSKQEMWRKRVNLLWRIKGMIIPMDAPMTETERQKLVHAQALIKEVVNDFTTSSVTLGFNVVERCHYCGKPAVNINESGFYVCKDCMQLEDKLPS